VTRRALAVLALIALGAAASGCPLSTKRVMRNYVVSAPDGDLATMAAACQAMPTRSCKDPPPDLLACVSDACIALCKRMMVLAGDGSYQDVLHECTVNFSVDGGGGFTALVEYDYR
jgi:hypothetical protein